MEPFKAISLLNSGLISFTLKPSKKNYGLSIMIYKITDSLTILFLFLLLFLSFLEGPLLLLLLGTLVSVFTSE